MRRSTLSILGLYNYDPKVFDGFRVPESIQGQRDAIIDEILLECAEYEIIYPDWDIMKLAIKRWTDLELPVWSELQSTREYEYNPIWNKDGVYIETETRDLAGTRAGTGSGSGETTDGSTTESSGNAEDIRAVQGFNSTTWADAEKNTRTTEAESTTNGTSTSSSDTEFEESTTDTGEITRERVEQGNIGVTTTQQMIKEQREVVTFSTERFIIDSFKKRFCLMIY